MSDLHEEFQKRKDVQPDKYTLAWWNRRYDDLEKQFRGATAAINRALADYEWSANAIDELRERIATLEKDRESDRAKIGEMAARLDRMAEFMNEIKKGKKG